jgi:PIN domain nuclease of toxin-antitoxin system
MTLTRTSNACSTVTTLLLLDRQATLWLLDDSPRLGPHARQLIVSATTVHVSAATVWELTIKAMLGKLSVPDKLASRLAEQGLVLLSITAEDTESIREFPELIRHDPFDRLVAQASQAGLQLLTADRVLLSLGRDFILNATK